MYSSGLPSRDMYYTYTTTLLGVLLQLCLHCEYAVCVWRAFPGHTVALYCILTIVPLESHGMSVFPAFCSPTTPPTHRDYMYM